MKDPGHPFRSKPYRFRCQNGGFALVETELSSFINPWSHKLEFIISQHTVLRGPANPDVTTPVSEPEPLQVSEEVLKEAKMIQEEIKCLLNKPCERTTVDVPTEEQSFSERDSVMLGEISPHHEYYDSKSSTETPPSYNQLNYNENIQRFFESNPKTTMSDESSDSKAASGGEEGKISPVNESIEDSKSGGSGGSSGAQSSESTENSRKTNTNGSNPAPTPTKNYKPTTLTEQLLTRHNEDMEKRMMQKHREQREKSDSNIKDRIKTNIGNTREETANHGVKRSGSHSWVGEPHKTIKAAHNTVERVSAPPMSVETEQPSNFFPTFSTPQDFPPATFASTLLPMYYVTNRRPEIPLFPQQVPYVPSMVYHPVMFSPQPVVYSPVTVIPAPTDMVCPPPITPLADAIPPSQAPPDLKPAASTSIFNKETRDSLAQDQKTDSYGTSLPFDDSSSSFYSLLKTDKSDESLRSSSENDTKQEETVWRPGKKGDRKTMPHIKKVAPWIEDIKVTPELVLKYKLRERPLEEVLTQDLLALKNFSQPELVSEQLSQMYLDLELEGLDQKVMFEEETSSSSDSSGDEAKGMKQLRKKYMEYDKMVILFEEDAPLPPPIVQNCS